MARNSQKKAACARLELAVLHDHNYCTTTSNGEIDLFDQLQTKQLDNVMPLGSEIESWYRDNVVLDHAEVIALEAETRGQSNDALWFCEGKKQITASLAKAISYRREDTPPEKLVSRIVQQWSLFSLATAYGMETEDKARAVYTQLMTTTKPSLQVRKVGLRVCVKHP